MAINPKLMKLAAKAFVVVASNPDALGKFLEKAGSMPNIKMKTMGGKVFWTDLVNESGWRLQKNNLFENCRILNPENERVAWGGESALLELFGQVVEKAD